MASVRSGCASEEILCEVHCVKLFRPHSCRGTTLSRPCQWDMMLLWSLFLPALVLHPAPTHRLPHPSRLAGCVRTAQLAACANEETKAITSSDLVVQGETTAMTKAEVEKIGNLVEDDEWLGLATELAIVFWSAVRETIKANVADFIAKTTTSKDDYKLDDVSKEADARIKGMVADLRGKDEYELGDLSIALDTLVKEEVRTMTDGLHDGLHDCLYDCL